MTIIRQMRPYSYSIYTNTIDDYGQETLTASNGIIKIALNITQQNIQDNILYSGAQYIGLTNDDVNDTYVINYGNEKLKVLYVNPIGRLKQV